MFLNILVSIVFISFLNFLIRKFKKDKKYQRKFYDFGDNNAIILVVSLLIISYFSITFLVSNPSFVDSKEKIEYGSKTGQPWLLTEEYFKIISKDTFNLDANFTILSAVYDPNQFRNPDVKKYYQDEYSLFSYYISLSKSTSTSVADVGNLFLGIYYYFNDDYANAEAHLEDVKNKKIKYLNNYLGIINYYNRNRTQAFEYLENEIRYHGYVKGAYYNLARYYDYEKNYQALFPFVYDKAINPFIPYVYQQRVYLMNYDISAYFKNIIINIFTNTNIYGFIGALLILLTWVFYLKKVNVYQEKRWANIVFTISLAALFVFPVWLLYDFYEYILGFYLNGGVVNDFFYCIFGIGFVEELVKIIPFLIILRFTSAIKEPIDYIFYASLSAVGFAFVENFRYFDNDSLNIIHSRALTASIAHIIFSSFPAYGLILAKFKNQKRSFFFFLLFFFIAVFSHGFYDFWLLNKVVSGYSFITFVYLLTIILIYASFVNNALNHSLSLKNNLNLNTSNLASILAASLTGVFLFEYLCASFIYGPEIGNRELLSSVFSGGYLILFLSIRLSNIDIVPGEWFPVEFFVGFNPLQIIYGDKKLNFNSLVGITLEFKAFRHKGILTKVLPLEGEIVKREKISGFSGWFLVKLNKPIAIQKVNREYILIRAKDKSKLIEKNNNDLISFVLIPDIELLNKTRKKLSDFTFVDWAIAN